ncbi:MAG: response regulator [Anaerolineae bacterium]
MSEEKPLYILCIEDDAGVARLIQKQLRRAGYAADTAADGEEGLAQYAAGDYDVVLVDQNMPRLSGLGVLERLLAQDEPPPTVMITGTGSEEIAVQAMKLGAGDYIVKDVEGGFLELLPAVIEQVLRQRRLAQEKQQAEEALRRYVTQLEEQNRELDAFAHTVAHDLKAPLAVHLGYTTMLQDGWAGMSPDEIGQSLQAVVRNALKLRNIVDELLLLASVRQGDITPAPLAMGPIVANACRRLHDMMEECGAELATVADWPLVMGYAPWIEEVWANYISNAIKYGGHPPQVALGATPQADGSVRFWVRDNGPGLTPDEQSRLFIPFTRLSQLRVSGHGLGLSIVERIVRRLGGNVGVESEVGKGSTFYFCLPVPPTDG